MRLHSQEATQSDTMPQESSPPLQLPFFSRRDLVRGALFAGAASTFGAAFSWAQSISSGLTPAAQGEDGTKFLTDPNWKALFLNDHQNETLIALGDVIIPATETPGAKEALADRFIDLLLSVQPEDFQKLFTDALASMDTASQELYGKDFVALPLDDQVALLTPWAYPQRWSRWTKEGVPPSKEQEAFGLLKSVIADAYYESEIGQKELGWGAGPSQIYDDCGSAAATPKPVHITTRKPTHK
jgi:hypothetical protein